MVDRHDVSTLGTALQRPSRGGGGGRLMPGHDGVSLASFVLGGDSRRRTGFVGIGACVFAGLHCSEETLEGRRPRGRIGDESLPGTWESRTDRFISMWEKTECQRTFGRGWKGGQFRV